jgi:N-acylglucosamine 2-epimerase
MAFGRLGSISGNEEYQQIAISTFERILVRADNPKGKYNKAYPNTRNLKGFALPMILCNLSMEIAPLLSEDTVTKLQEDIIHQVMNQFYNPEKKVILENINQDNTFSDTYDGRLLNPGHAIEAMWFIMDLAEKRNNSKMIQKAVKITLDTLEYGWDKEHGGIFYFMDVLGKPPQQLEWDQKLWWVHLETLISLIKGYYLTGNENCLTWFEKVHQYTWEQFRDTKNGGEWFGYLNRQGEVLLQLKGGKWKGCFHVPRGLLQCWQTLEKIIEKTNY